jgi:hypothetical protein
MDLSPTIWISSIDHSERFKEIVGSKRFWQFLGVSNIPDDFPTIDNKPLLYFSRGELTLKNKEISYNTSKVKKGLFTNYHNLKEDLSFVLTSSDIKSIEWYQYEKVFPKHNRKWIRITCDASILGGGFLIRADGIKNTEKLFKILNQLKEGQITTSLNTLSSGWVLIGYMGVILYFIGNVLDWIYHLIYGTLNVTGGSIVVILIPLGILLYIIFLIWSLSGLKQNTKVRKHYFLLLLFFVIIYFISNIGLLW